MQLPQKAKGFYTKRGLNMYLISSNFVLSWYIDILGIKFTKAKPKNTDKYFDHDPS